MNTSNPIFHLQNFRSFSIEGADFEIAPITVITGCNSAGKSSFVKALMLLSEQKGFVEEQKLNFSSKNLCLGNYKSVAHEEGNILFSYNIWCEVLQEELIVTRSFYANRADELKNGVFDYLTIEEADGTKIFHLYEERPLRIEPKKYYFDTVKDKFFKFYYICKAMRLLEFLPAVKKWEEDNKDSDSIDSKTLNRHVSQCLKKAHVTKSNAEKLWKTFGRDIFLDVINVLGYYETYSSMLKLNPQYDWEWNLMMEKFIDCIVKDACNPFFLKDVFYVNSSSSPIARLYSTEDENKMCNALREMNNRKITYQKLEDKGLDYNINIPGEFIGKWVKKDKFDIGDSIEIKGTDEGLGLMIYIKNGENKRLLADEGYGITQLISLLIQIDNCIPVCVDCDYINSGYTYKPITIYVEEPEVHLHPKYQSMLAEMFVEAYQKYNIRFIIETHSEYLIRKLQVMVADKENSLKSQDVSLNYVEKDDNGVSTNRKIEIMEDGRLSDSFGSGFYDEADTLALDLFRKKTILS